MQNQTPERKVWLPFLGVFFSWGKEGNQINGSFGKGKWNGSTIIQSRDRNRRGISLVRWFVRVWVENPQINFWCLLQATLSKCPGYLLFILARLLYAFADRLPWSKIGRIISFSLARLRSMLCISFVHLVGALGLDVAGLLALVASTLAASLGRAVSREMTDLTAVVALLSLGAVTWFC